MFSIHSYSDSDVTGYSNHMFDVSRNLQLKDFLADLLEFEGGEGEAVLFYKSADPQKIYLLRANEGFIDISVSENNSFKTICYGDAAEQMVNDLNLTFAGVFTHGVLLEDVSGCEYPHLSAVLIDCLSSGEGLYYDIAVATCVAMQSYAVKHLVLGLTIDDPYINFHAARVLGLLGSEAKSALPELLKAMKDEFFDVRKEAAIAVCAISTNLDNVMVELEDFLEKEASDAQSILAELIEVEGMKLVPLCEKILANPYSYLPESGRRGLESLGLICTI